MKIRMIGKSTGTVGAKMIQIKGSSGRRFPFVKEPGVGYVYESQTDQEAEEIFNTQSNRFAYYFQPVFQQKEETVKSDPVEFEDLDFDGLKSLCSELGIETVAQDKERSLKRLLTAYNKGLES